MDGVVYATSQRGDVTRQRVGEIPPGWFTTVGSCMMNHRDLLYDPMGCFFFGKSKTLHKPRGHILMEETAGFFLFRCFCFLKNANETLEAFLKWFPPFFKTYLAQE